MGGRRKWGREGERQGGGIERPRLGERGKTGGGWYSQGAIEGRGSRQPGGVCPRLKRWSACGRAAPGIQWVFISESGSEPTGMVARLIGRNGGWKGAKGVEAMAKTEGSFRQGLAGEEARKGRNYCVSIQTPGCSSWRFEGILLILPDFMPNRWVTLGES